MTKIKQFLKMIKVQHIIIDMVIPIYIVTNCLLTNSII